MSVCLKEIKDETRTAKGMALQRDSAWRARGECKDEAEASFVEVQSIWKRVVSGGPKFGLKKIEGRNASLWSLREEDGQAVGS